MLRNLLVVGLALGFTGTILVAESAGASVTQVLEGIMALMAVFPGDVHALPGGEVDLDGFRVRGPGNS